MEHRYVVEFAAGHPDTPETKDEQIDLARIYARRHQIPNAESKPQYRVGRNSHTGQVFGYVEWRWVE